jgi:hypothetical protein
VAFLQVEVSLKLQCNALATDSQDLCFALQHHKVTCAAEAHGRSLVEVLDQAVARQAGGPDYVSCLCTALASALQQLPDVPPAVPGRPVRAQAACTALAQPSALQPSERTSLQASIDELARSSASHGAGPAVLAEPLQLDLNAAPACSSAHCSTDDSRSRNSMGTLGLTGPFPKGGVPGCQHPFQLHDSIQAPAATAADAPKASWRTPNPLFGHLVK